MTPIPCKVWNFDSHEFTEHAVIVAFVVTTEREHTYQDGVYETDTVRAVVRFVDSGVFRDLALSEVTYVPQRVGA